MDRRIDARIARTQFGHIMDLATKNNERFFADGLGTGLDRIRVIHGRR